MSEPIKEGDHVVLMRSFDSGNMKIIAVERGATIHYGKFHFDPTPIIGSTYGSVFEILDQTMKQVSNFEEYDIELTGLVSNRMPSLGGKSEFSREKIIKKKKKKCHSNVVTVMKPTLLLVNEMLFAREKIAGLRSDVIGQILTLSNVQNGTKCLLLDHNLGMLTSAVMSRILPDGVCIQMLPDSEAMQTTRKTMNMLNIRDEDCTDNLFAITIRDFYKVYKNTDSFTEDNVILEERDIGYKERMSQEILESANEDFNELTKEGNKLFSEEEREQFKQVLIRKAANRKSRNEERVGAARLLRQSPLDSLIMIVQHEHPLQLLKMSYPFLALSGRFVIFSNTIGPLLECYHYLKSNCIAVSVNLSESWLRKYQVLPDRTRPEMNTSGFGGYLLSGTRAFYGTTGGAGGD